jgi:hypothetical protein
MLRELQLRLPSLPFNNRALLAALAGRGAQTEFARIFVFPGAPVFWSDLSRLITVVSLLFTLLYFHSSHGKSTNSRAMFIQISSLQSSSKQSRVRSHIRRKTCQDVCAEPVIA